MNQTGVASTGSRRQAFRNLEVVTHGLTGDAQELARERDQLLEPERLVAQLGAERLDLVARVIVEVVVAGDDGDRRVGEAGNRANGAQKLQAARQRHPQVEDDGVRPVGLGEGQPFVGRQRRPHFVAFQTKHSRKRVGRGPVVVHDEDARRGRAAPKHPGIVALTRRIWFAGLVLYSPVLASFFGGILSRPEGLDTRYVHSPEVLLSPILVRPVREQLEHDRVIRLLQAKYKRKFEVAINPGHEQNAPVGGPPPWFPDLVLQSSDKSRQAARRRRGRDDGVDQSPRGDVAVGDVLRLRVPFHLYVPAGSVDSARRLCQRPADFD